MPRIVYSLIGTQAQRGGHKVSLRHVEALAEMGFSAVAQVSVGQPAPAWFDHSAPVQVAGALNDDDILVFPEDATDLLKEFAFSPHRKIVFCQNQFLAGIGGIGVLSREELAGYRDFIACSQTVARWLARFTAHRSIAVIPAFADERRFTPSGKTLSVACTPRKRRYEFQFIRMMVSRLYSGRAQWRWAAVESKSEQAVAETFGQASVFLSLNRLEGLGMTTLEAMAAGCIPVGFTGIGGREYATATNGFWIDEDDCEACATALVEVMGLVERNSPIAHMVRTSAQGTAALWTHTRFQSTLRQYWAGRLRPEFPVPAGGGT